MLGFSIGLVNPPLASTAVVVVPPERSGMASGINNTFRQVGIATGIAALGAVFLSSVHDKVITGLAGTPAGANGRAQAMADAVGSGQVGRAAASAPAAVRGQLAEVARSAFVSGLNELFVIAAIIAFAGALLVAVLLRGLSLGEHAQAAEPEAVAA